jgi:hypothetical protein
MYQALLGAGMTVGGGIANTLGQQQAIDAIQKLWGKEQGRQKGYDAQAQARTQQLLHDLALENQLGTNQVPALTGTLDQASINAANAVAASGARRPNAGGAEGAAVARQRGQRTLADALKDNRFQAMIAALMQAGQKTNATSRQYGLDLGLIRDDARSSASLLGMGEQVASMRGQAARQIGSMFDAGGQGLMSYAMSQPRASGYGGSIPSDGGQVPQGGWAASTVSQDPYGAYHAQG